MAYEKRDLTWSLFKNETKTQDTHSDYQGWLVVNGQEYWLNGWLKDGAKGKFFSGPVKPTTGRPHSGNETAKSGGVHQSPRDEMSDEIPF
jgi:hypothetical protein